MGQDWEIWWPNMPDVLTLGFELVVCNLLLHEEHTHNETNNYNSSSRTYSNKETTWSIEIVDPSLQRKMQVIDELKK